MATSFTQRRSGPEPVPARSATADPAAAASPSSQQLKEFRLHLMTQLQTTLDIEQILRIFFNEIQHQVELSGCHYRTDSDDLNIQLGETGRHSCHYDLELNDERFGRISFTRGRRLLEREMALLERVMDALIYPLRNALLYRKAVATAMLDPLTGLSNRGAMAMTLNREMDRMRRHDQFMSILMLDIDFFKEFNDRYGHLAGDDVLRQVARLIENSIRGCDACFRFGGEEFLVMLTDSNLPLARMVAERLRHSIETETRRPGAKPPLTVSIGIAHYDQESDWPALVNRADQALYQAKKEGRNLVRAG